MTENQSEKPGHTYVMDPESPTEMARLMLQDRFITEGMQGIFSERSNLGNIQAILDVGCGPGGWALDVAHTYPDKAVVGVDISTTMITYAQAQATAQRLTNVTFAVMNALEPLNFAEETFDLVNVRFAIGFVIGFEHRFKERKLDAFDHFQLARVDDLPGFLEPLGCAVGGGFGEINRADGF